MAVSYLHYLYPRHPERLTGNGCLRDWIEGCLAARLLTPERELSLTYVDGPSQRVREEIVSFAELPPFAEDSDEIRLAQQIQPASDSGTVALFEFGRRSGRPHAGYRLQLVWSHYPRLPRFALPVGAEVLCRACAVSLVDSESWGRLELDPRVFHLCPACGHQLKLSRTSLRFPNPADPEDEALAVEVETALYRVALIVDCAFDWPVERMGQRQPSLLSRAGLFDELGPRIGDSLVEIGGFW